MTFQINPINDLPEKDAKLLGHEQIVNNLNTFLDKDNLISPLSIAIHGDWGSGKTSIMKTLSTKLDSDKFEVIFFEAWKYEYTNPSLGLIAELSEAYGRDLKSEIMKAGVYILSQKFLGTDPNSVYNIIRSTKQHTETLPNNLKHLIDNYLNDKKLIIIIDDLDRCDVENTLQLLSIIKLFFDLENCICIAAVDFNRLKQAWRQKYLVGPNDDGSEYLDKIFQIRIGIPKPTLPQLEEYVKTLITNLPDNVANLFSTTLPNNPRMIKRVLNLISYRTNLLTSEHKDHSAIYWTLLEQIISNKEMIRVHDLLIKNGSSLGHLIVRVDSWKSIKDLFERTIGNDIITKHASKLYTFFEKSREISHENDISDTNINDDFKNLYSATNEIL